MFKYRTVQNAHGEIEYELFDVGSGDVISTMSEVGFMFDVSCSVLLKHGHPDIVRKIYDDTRMQYIKGGLEDVANDLMCIWGPFNVDEVNKCLDICDYIGILYKREFPMPITKFEMMVSDS